MKRTILSLLLILGATLSSYADDIAKIKSVIITHLTSGNENEALVKELAHRDFPKGVNTDQCIVELVAYALPSNSEIESLISTLSSEGSWSDIDYASRDRSRWSPMSHLGNILNMARCYRAERSDYCGSEELLDATLRAIEFWCNEGIRCRNWWFNDIGVPKILAPAVLLLEEEMSPELMARCIKILDAADRQMTGQNKVWLSDVTLTKALLLQDEEMLSRTSQAIREEIVISSGAGIQADYSYHQHGPMLQFGNYGLAFALSQSYWLIVLSDTEYDFTAEQKEIMHNYFERGLNVCVWRGYMDVTSCARQLFINCQSGKATSLLLSNLNMMHIDDDRSIYEDYILRNFITPDNNNLVGNFSYPFSKYSIQRGSDYFVSVKAFSTKVMGGEITNRENLKGYYLSDGTTMIYRTGREYDNIYAAWDGHYMPGTTVVNNDEPLKIIEHGRYYLNGSDFAGCLSSREGEWGLAAFEYRRDGVSANKSWFFIGEDIICLGDGIESESGEALVTTLNQCNFQDEGFTIRGKKEVALERESAYSGTRVFSDGVGYRTLDGSTIEFGVKSQRGDWREVAEFYESQESVMDIFTAQIHHAAGEIGSYAYVVSPSAERSSFLKGRKEGDFKVVSNDSVASCVESKSHNITMVVFWSEGEVESSLFGRISSTAPVMVIIEGKGDDMSYQIYDPLESGAKIDIER